MFKMIILIYFKFIILIIDKEFKKQLGLEKCIKTNESSGAIITFHRKEIKCYNLSEV